VTDLAKKRADELVEIKRIPPLESDPVPGMAGILLSDQITYFAQNHNLLAPFSKENLKPAGYELTVGDEYFMSGQYLALESHITIQPFEVAVIKTGERLRLPRFMIARWNIRVRHAYAGLLWVGGPQVDPGYSGYLFCPIYNLSDKPVTLYKGEPLALMDFRARRLSIRKNPKATSSVTNFHRHVCFSRTSISSISRARCLRAPAERSMSSRTR
jgi:deoxycytidine triphosphate deaminase